MISLEQYFNDPHVGEPKTHTPEDEERARDLLARRQALREEYYAATGRGPDIDPDTGTEISGKKNGDGDGGFRIRGSATSAGRKSSHEEACGVDDSDQQNLFDDWLSGFDVNGSVETGFLENAMLEKHGLYREAPAATPTWCHLTTRAPKSGKRTFIP